MNRPPPVKIRTDDLEALGDMASLVGTYMADYANKAEPGERRNLFKTNFSPKHLITKALVDEEDIAQRVVQDDSVPKPQQPPQEEALPPVVSSTVKQTIETINKPLNEQLEFSFIKQVVQGYGTVEEVIRHFDDRFDDIEDDIKAIKKQITKINNSLHLLPAATNQGTPPP